jgi:hypothetical protein
MKDTKYESREYQEIAKGLLNLMGKDRLELISAVFTFKDKTTGETRTLTLPWYS